MKLGIQARTIYPVILILVLVMVGLAFFNYTSQVELLNRNATNTLGEAVKTANHSLESRMNQYQQMATLVAKMPSVKQLFKDGKRNDLFGEFSSSFTTLKNDYGLAQFQFHKPPATSFLRVHREEKYGDDLSGFRHTVLYVNRTKNPVQGVEIGRAGIGLRGVQPVTLDGVHVGSVEFGGAVAPVLNETKDIFAVDLGVLISSRAATQVWKDAKEKVASIGAHIPIYSTNTELTNGLLTNKMLQRAQLKDEEVYIQRARFGKNEYFVALSPLKDYSGKQIGFVNVIMDGTATFNEIKRSLVINIAIYAVILLLVSAAINFSLKRTVIAHVIQLTKAADGVSMGELDKKVEVSTDDELSVLAKSIDRMRVSMRKLLK